MRKVTSILGEVTPIGTPIRNMLCYTINLSPDYYIHQGKWGDKSPTQQYVILKRIHRTLYLKMFKYITCEDIITNEVAFEFTKAGEVHSHGYYILDDKYGGYDKYKYMLMKLARAAMVLPSWNYNAIFTRYADDPQTWINYLNKELTVSGFEKYIADIESETTVLSILDFIKTENKNHYGGAENRALTSDLSLTQI